MISPRKLIRIARKWQKAAALRRKRISLPGSSEAPCLAGRGSFVVYTMEHKRFKFPIKYLCNSIVRELLRLSEEEFGLPGDGPIKLPCGRHNLIDPMERQTRNAGLSCNRFVCGQ